MLGVRKLVIIKLFLKSIILILIALWLSFSISKKVFAIKKDIEEIKALQIVQLVYLKEFNNGENK